jgi:hypothetical protein
MPVSVRGEVRAPEKALSVSNATAFAPGAFASAAFRRISCALLFFVAASASFNGYYDKWHFREAGVRGAEPSLDLHRYGIAYMLDGTATRPFAYRQLLPSVANWLDQKTPPWIKDSLYQGPGRTSIAEFMFDSPLARDRKYFYRYSIVYVSTFLFAWLATYAMYLVCRALEVPPAACLLAPVSMILLMPYLFSGGGFFYDYPELAFLALAVWMGFRFDWWWMLPLVALATWNKESFLLITLTLYPILRSRSSRTSALTGTAILGLTCAAVYLAVRWQVRLNPGVTVVQALQVQLAWIRHPMNLLSIEKTYGIVMFRALTLVPLAFIGWIVWRAWPRLPAAIRRHGQIAAAINLPLYFLFCAPGEIRDLSMMYIVFMLSLAANLPYRLQRPRAAGDAALAEAV